jgi:hypothetical protein
MRRLRKHTFYTYLILLFSLSSCTKYIQVVTTSSNSKEVNEQDSYLTFENDTIQIVYSFWNENGIMAFNVYNKLNVPLYIDWKKSSFIDMGNKLDYFFDIEVKKNNASYTNYLNNRKINFTDLFSLNNVGFVSGQEISRKEERITFIPPKSSINLSKYLIMPDSFFGLNNDYRLRIDERSDNPKKTTKVYYKELNENTSPKKFRNFLTLSLTENFGNEFYIDNSFFISKIEIIDDIHFKGKQLNLSSQTPIYSIPFKDPKKFFYKINITRPR